jgi:hypothetical protein
LLIKPLKNVAFNVDGNEILFNTPASVYLGTIISLRDALIKAPAHDGCPVFAYFEVHEHKSDIVFCFLFVYIGLIIVV